MKKCYKLLAVLLALVMAMAPLTGTVSAAENIASGKYSNITWVLDNTGKLTISGTGQISAFWAGSWSSFSSQITSVEIQNGPTEISSNAFSNCTQLESVTIPNSVTYIGNSAFLNCSKLSTINIPNSVTYIGNSAFLYCSKLSTVIIPESITYVGSSAFNYTAWYDAQPEGLIYVGHAAYKYKGNCPSAVELKAGTTMICDNAFISCTNLESITVPDSMTKIGSYAFYNCVNLKNITIPDGVKEIGDSAFFGCSKLESIIIPDSVIFIGMRTFCDCSNLKSAVLSNSVTNLMYGSFCNTGLTSITIPNSVTSIDANTFSDCTDLAEINFSNNLDYIDYSAFDNTAWYNAQPEGLIYTGNILSICKGECPSDVVVKEGTTAITSGVFCYSPQLNSIILPKSITKINPYAFYGCTNLTSATIPDGVTEIGDFAFFGCSKLESIIIPDSVTSIGYAAFSNCTNLTSATLSSSVTELVYGAFAYSGLTSIIIPDGVTSISDSFFSGCTDLKSVTIPNSVTYIGWNAFNNCTSLTDIIIPESVSYIDRNAFSYCTNLQSAIILGNVTELVYGSFCNTGLKSITIPESVQRIQSAAFDNCNDLTDVYYYGSESNWEKISIGFGNGNLTSRDVTKHYNCVTAIFDTDGGSTIDNWTGERQEGDTYNFDAPTKDNYKFAGWYTSDKYTTRWNNKISANTNAISLYAKWVEKQYTINGTVTDNAGTNPESGVTVTLKSGNNEITSITTDENGTYCFENVNPGLYSVVAVKDKQSITKSVNVTGNDETLDIKMPSAGTSSTLKLGTSDTANDTPDIVVAGLDIAAEEIRTTETFKGAVAVEVSMSIATTKEEDIPEDTVMAIKEVAKDVESIEYLAIDLNAYVTQNVNEVAITKPITSTNQVFEIVVPYVPDKNAVGQLIVIRYHDTEAEEFINSTSHEDGTFYYDQENHFLHIFTNKFSVYGTGYKNIVESIELINAPAKTEYIKGVDALNIAGCKIKAIWSNSEETVIDVLSSMVTGFDNTKLGKQTLTVTYEDKTCTFDVTIKNSEESTACVYTKHSALTEGKHTLVLGGKQAGTYTMTHVKDGWLLKNEDNKYLAFDKDSKQVIKSSTSYTWQYDGGLYTSVTSSVKSFFWWFYKNKTVKYYLHTDCNSLSVSACYYAAQIQTVIEADAHTYTYHDNLDGTHDAICCKCGYHETHLEHIYDQITHKCVCGKFDPDFQLITNVMVFAKKDSKSVGWWFWKKTISTYSYTISVDTKNVRISKVEYSNDGTAWKKGSHFTSDVNLSSFYIRVTDANGKVTKWYYDGTETQAI